MAEGIKPLDQQDFISALGVTNQLAQAMNLDLNSMLKELNETANDKALTPALAAARLAKANNFGKLAELCGKSMEAIQEILKNLVSQIRGF